jgi:hypothetical protein
MITQEKLYTIGDCYIRECPLASHMLGFIQERGAIVFEDLQMFYVSHYDLLDDDQRQELEKDGLVKFFLDALMGYGFVEQGQGNYWRFVVGRDRL